MTTFIDRPDAPYVIDRTGLLWLVVRDGGMVMRANEQSPTGVTSAGIAWLDRTAGPLVGFDPIGYRREHLPAGGPQ
jgi:hypothetical protein